MSHPTLRIHDFAPGGEEMPHFAAMHGRQSYAGADEPVPRTARCLLALRGDHPVARLSYMTAAGLAGAPGWSGLIGHYEAAEQHAGIELLERARQALCEAGAVRVLGPVNGSTWARYRLALPHAQGENPAEPPFLSEPWNPPDYPGNFTRAGFRPAVMYASAIVRALAEPDPRRGELEARLRERGVTTRPLVLERFDEELEGIFGLTLAAFAQSPYYSPIELPEFRARYAPLRPLVDPELVRLAHDANGRLLGYVFAFPDRLHAPGGRPSRVVLKTLATAPGARGLGLGGYLTDEVRRIAHERGYAAVIHALMHAQNPSVRISRHTAEIFRHYALYEWTP